MFPHIDNVSQVKTKKSFHLMTTLLFAREKIEYIIPCA